MYKGARTEGVAFFTLLYEDASFCEEFGRCMLAAARLEAIMIIYLRKNNIQTSEKETLGQLINSAKKNSLLTKMIPALEMLKIQRNFLTHNLYAIFMGLIEDPILPNKDLLDGDVGLFTERAYLLRENLEGLADILNRDFI